MKEYNRKNHLFSLCGLSCNLCVMYIGGYCPGCGNNNHSCRLKKCAINHQQIEYCNQCREFPCHEYERINEYDSFITGRNRFKDFDHLNEIGEKAFINELEQKASILKILLNDYNDGRKKTYYCLAINLLELSDIKIVMKQVKELIKDSDSLKDKASKCASCFDEMARKRDIILKLYKKRK